jgi:hypothetical protein
MTEKTSAAESRGCFCLGTGPQMSEMFRNCVSESAIDHFRNSRIEFLKGLRSLIDSRIERLSRTHQRGTSVPVE